jgi:hypothetical protein
VVRLFRTVLLFLVDFEVRDDLAMNGHYCGGEEDGIYSVRQGACCVPEAHGWQECEREQSREGGCNGHLVKPVAFEELFQMLDPPSSSR